jgi:hypothetical protein
VFDFIPVIKVKIDGMEYLYICRKMNALAFAEVIIYHFQLLFYIFCSLFAKENQFFERQIDKKWVHPA